HLPSTGHIKAFKLKESPSQSYWKGKEGNPEMQRIYGYAFFTKEELDQHLHRLEEAKRRDHRKLGRELDLFSISDDTGAGLVLWHPKGAFIRKQIEDEILRVLDFVTGILKTFGFDRYDIYLSTKPDKASGTDEQWEVATAALKRALETRKLPYVVDPGEGVFYGPKIDIKIKDLLDRAWQCSTIQVDFHNPNRFQLEFIGEDGKAHQPVMI